MSGSAATVSALSEYADTWSATDDVGPGRVEEAAAEARLGRERQRVEDAVELAADVAGQRGEVVLVGHVELDDLHVGRREPLGGALGEAHHPAERAEHHLGALLLREPSGREGDRGVVEDAGDEDALALEHD